MAKDNKTEQATPRRRQKARERGQVARSRELTAALVMLAVVFFLWWQPQDWAAQWRELFGRVLVIATAGELEMSTGPLRWTGWVVMRWAGPVVLFGWVVAVVSLVGQGGLVLAPVGLSPKWQRLSPAGNLSRLFSLASLSRLLKSLLPMGLILYFSAATFSSHWDQIIHASQVGVRVSLAWFPSLAFEIAWKAGLVLLLWSGVDYLLQRQSFERQLRMSRQEVRDEMREIEGDPTIRGRIRRLQREMRRRRMAKDVALSTVVVTNPNEYAVALEYQPETMEAPVLVAKGRNLLAQQIKQIARWHGIPLVENPPLAQALYRAVEVGQTIPAKLYTVVAEILAFIYRVQARMPATAIQATKGNQGPVG